jgi:DNA-binding transcriptional regulator YhcF (GntR family)
VLVKIWISKNSEVPVRDQLIAQITLAIAASDFVVGEKLPSTREVARRCDIHPNTVSAVYQRLVAQRLLEFRKGSGFYVAERANERIEGNRKLEKLIDELLIAGRELGFDEADIARRIRKQSETRGTSRLIVVESDEALREILVHELTERFPDTRGISFEDFLGKSLPATAVLTAMPDEKPKIDPHLMQGQRCVYLQGRSVSASMTGQVRPGADETVAVVSKWENFLTYARIMLLAADLDPGNLIVRSTIDEGWRNAISHASVIVCDSLTAKSLVGLAGVRPFHIISDPSFAELTALL